MSLTSVAPAASGGRATSALTVSTETRAPARGQGGHHGHHPGQLHLDRHRLGARARGLAADVDHVGPLGHHGQAVGHRRSVVS